VSEQLFASNSVLWVAIRASHPQVSANRAPLSSTSLCLELGSVIVCFSRRFEIALLRKHILTLDIDELLQY
jgi:hypothetical protein